MQNSFAHIIEWKFKNKNELNYIMDDKLSICILYVFDLSPDKDTLLGDSQICCTMENGNFWTVQKIPDVKSSNFMKSLLNSFKYLPHVYSSTYF